MLCMRHFSSLLLFCLSFCPFSFSLLSRREASGLISSPATSFRELSARASLIPDQNHGHWPHAQVEPSTPNRAVNVLPIHYEVGPRHPPYFHKTLFIHTLYTHSPCYALRSLILCISHICSCINNLCFTHYMEIDSHAL